jgi:hypothetical protein
MCVVYNQRVTDVAQYRFPLINKVMQRWSQLVPELMTLRQVIYWVLLEQHKDSVCLV